MGTADRGSGPGILPALHRHLGDLPVAAYTRQHAGLFRETVQRLPADYGKAARYRGLATHAILETHQASQSKSPLLTQKTNKRHFSALFALWEEAFPKGDVAENILSGFRFSGTKRVADQRAMWTREELAQLFASPIWSGCLSIGRRTTPGSRIFRDERFWLPLIAVFSGMRQEEICQLHLEDVKEAEGIWIFDVNDRAPRQLKNANAVRCVPIHSELIDLGLLTYAASLRQQGEKRLFPALKGGGADERLGHAFTKWFTRYRRGIGLYRPGLDFHSFRHSATTFMHQAGAERTVIDHLTGHSTPGETSRYTKGSSLKQLKNAVDAITIGVDLSALEVRGSPS